MSPSNISRREFLRWTALVGGAALLPTVLGGCRADDEYAAQVGQIWAPPSTSPDVRMHEILRYATLAANSHNAQAWKFAVKDQAIEIHPDFTRRLTVVDPHDRELWISLGCALENLLIAARSYGLAGEVSYPDTANPWITARLTPAAPAADRLFHAIPLRQNTRSEYSGAAASAGDLRQVDATPLEAGVGLKVIADRFELETVVEYVNAGNVQQYGDPAFLQELISWLRFNESEALASLDGLYAKCSGNPTVPRWLGEKFVAGTKPAQQADADAKKLRSSAGAAIITTTSDDPASWVRAGRVYERLALAMTALDLKSAFLNQPIEAPGIRPQFQSAFGLGDQMPQLLMRFGYTASLPKSLRRPVEAVLI